MDWLYVFPGLDCLAQSADLFGQFCLVRLQRRVVLDLCLDLLEAFAQEFQSVLVTLTLIEPEALPCPRIPPNRIACVQHDAVDANPLVLSDGMSVEPVTDSLALLTAVDQQLIMRHNDAILILADRALERADLSGALHEHATHAHDRIAIVTRWLNFNNR